MHGERQCANAKPCPPEGMYALILTAQQIVGWGMTHRPLPSFRIATVDPRVCFLIPLEVKLRSGKEIEAIQNTTTFEGQHSENLKRLDLNGCRRYVVTVNIIQ